LRIFTWSDYLKPELLERFEQENGCRIVVETYDSNEALYDSLVARDREPFDLLFPSSYMVKILRKQGMLLPLNHDWIPNRRNVDPSYLEQGFDPRMRFSVPYAVTVTSLGYLAQEVPDFQPSWKVFDRPDLRGSMTLLADVRETIGAALKSLGYSLNSTNDQELAAAKEVVLRWKRNAAGFENEGYKDELAAGAIRLAHGYSGDLMLAQAENEDVRIAVPEEGSALSFDDMAIPADAREILLAHKFIDFILDPRVAAEMTEYICYLCPNEVSYQYLSAEIRTNPILFPPPEVVERLEMIADLGPANAKYAKLWEEIQAGK
jgi:spermidine/putrescine transport system substrate-binding protein